MSRTVLVTGAATGIGRAVAARLAADGDTVHITGRRRHALDKTAADLGAHAIVCDATDPTALAELLDALPDRLDVLVNNAGGNTDFDADVDTSPATDQLTDPVTELTRLAAAWHANLTANLLSAVLTTRALAPRLNPGGSVINLGSIAAAYGAGAYGSAKAALASWNIELAKTLGPHGITANVIAPGYIADTEFFRDRMTQTRRDTLAAATATGRTGTVEDIAATVRFLASPDARHITGQTLHVNGGALPTR
jgi:3-oxoacyl-[acyl-carrier protein] reductase